jgi:hypothetical protein
VTGQQARRVLQGVRNSRRGGVLCRLTETWEPPPQAFLEMMRRHGSGWHSSLCEERGAPQTAATRRQRAKALGLEGRCLPRATPELTALEHRWR